MKLQTGKLKEKLLRLEDSQERLKVLKNMYEGETAYIVAAGPSLNNYSKEYLKEFMKNKLCMPIKQSYTFLKEVSDFHLLNFCNFSPYDWSGNKSIVTWGIFEQFHPKLIFENNLEPINIGNANIYWDFTDMNLFPKFNQNSPMLISH